MKKITRGHIYAFLEKYKTEEKVLDIGSSKGDHLEYFPNRTSLDIDPARNPDIVGDAEKLPFDDNSFGVIVCSEVFEHIPDTHQAVREMRRVLKPGGLLVLTTRFAFPVHDAPGDFWRFTPYGLEKMFDGWDILEVTTETNSFETLAVLLQRIIFQSKLHGGKVTKGLLWALAGFIQSLSFLTIEEYGDIKRTQAVKNLVSSGVYIACRNTKT